MNRERSSASRPTENHFLIVGWRHEGHLSRQMPRLSHAISADIGATAVSPRRRVSLEGSVTRVLER